MYVINTNNETVIIKIIIYEFFVVVKPPNDCICLLIYIYNNLNFNIVLLLYTNDNILFCICIYIDEDIL